MALGSPQWMYKSGEAYTIDQSLKFDRSSLGHLDWTPSTASTRKKWTFSFWVKPSMMSSSDSNPCIFNAQDTGTRPSDSMNFVTQAANNAFHMEAYNGSAYNYRLRTTQVFRDPSAWYHLVIAFDTTQSTASNRVKIYVNGEQITDFALSVYPDQNHQTGFLNTVRHRFSNTSWTDDPSLGNQLSGYLAEVNMIDGQQLTPSDFGETGTYGEWKPKEYSGTYGTNGFYLPFKNDYTVEGFSTVTYKGSGVSPNYIGGTGFRPDLTWIKPRSVADNHVLYDSVRGYDKQLKANGTDAEDNNRRVASATDGFKLKTTDQNQNSSSHTYVAWNWDMGANTPTGFGCVTYAGSSSAQDIGDIGFSPDLCWIKTTSHTEGHQFVDTIRGNTKSISSSSTEAENTYTDGLLQFQPDGFRVGTNNRYNYNNYNYVAWCWDMGGTSVSNTTGDNNSTVRANTTYGQSVVSYSGSGGTKTVGHGLSSAPEMVIVKNRTDGSTNWNVYHKDCSTNKSLYLNESNPENPNGNIFFGDGTNLTAPTSSVFTVGNNAQVNGSGKDYIAYAFHSVANYSSIGSYTGNGSSTGTSVTLGFRPAFVMIKVADRTDGGNGAWWVYDSTRSFGTAIGNVSLANTSGVELVNNSNLAIDFLDNGFQLKSSYDEINVNNGKYVYMAFAGGVDSVSDFNTDGSLEARVKANPTYGQSIAIFNAGASGTQSFGHGLNSTPEIIIYKSRSSSQHWPVWTSLTGSPQSAYLYLNLTNAVATDTSQWSNTAPTSSVATFNSGYALNAQHDTVAYCFHSVTGYSKCGSYSGTNNASGNSVTLGFEPAWVLIKNSSGTNGWICIDNTRGDKKMLSPSNSNAEETLSYLDFTSTGFDLITNHPNVNGDGGTYIYMAFADKREYAYWLDQSPNNNDWTSNNLTESDISVDSPTNNFCTWNPSHRGDAGSNLGTLSEGNLKIHYNEAGSGLCLGTMAPTSGKWYCEFTYIHGDAASDRTAVGIADPDSVDVDANGNDKKMFAATTTEVSGLNRLWLTDNVESDNNFPERIDGSIIQFAWDMDAGKFWIGTNNQWSNSSGGNIPISDVVAGNNSTVTDSGCVGMTPVSRLSAGGTLTNTHFLNCGQDSSFSGTKTAQGYQDSNGIGDFYYEPPSGFLALCTDNLPDVAVKPSEHFNTLLYTGDNTANRSITGVGFAPDFIWAKERNNTAHHVLVDSVRGTSSGGRLSSNRTNAEDNTGGVTIDSFDSDGFTTGSSYAFLNGSTPFVAWNWKAGTSVSGNSSGSGTTTSYTGSVNTDAGFSIIKYTGNATAGLQIPHHLGVVPDAIFIKSLTVQSWNCFFPNTSLGATKGLQLDNDGAEGTVSHLNNTMPTTSVVTLGTGAGTNTSADGVGQEYIMYCWANKDGYLKVGSYTGTGNSDGTFVYTGHRPSLVLVKSNSRAESWGIYDSERLGYNPNNRSLYPNLANAEHSSTDHMDILSNGFKLYSTNHNGTGESYIFLSIAETPFKYSNGR